MESKDLTEIIKAYEDGSSIRFRNLDRSLRLKWTSITKNPDTNMLIAVCKNKVARSYNGKDWTFIELKGDWIKVLYSNDTFVIISADGNLAFSQNGYIWTRVETNFDSFKDIASDGNNFVVVSCNNKIYTSTNLLGWVEQPLIGNWKTIISTRSGYIIAGTNVIARSPNGTNWTIINTTEINDANTGDPIGDLDINSVAYGISRCVFVAPNAVLYTTDFERFYKIEEGLQGDWFKIKFLNEKFIALAPGSYMYSGDGSNYIKINLIHDGNDIEFLRDTYVIPSTNLMWDASDVVSAEYWEFYELSDDWRVITEYDTDVIWDSINYEYEILDDPVYEEFTTTLNLITEYYNRFHVEPCKNYEEPMIWLIHKNTGKRMLITCFDTAKVTLNGISYSMESLFNNFTFNDGSIIGKLES